MADDFKYTPPAEPDLVTESGDQIRQQPSVGAESGQEPVVQAPTVASSSVSWQSSEFIEHEKNIAWFMGLAAGTIVLAVAIYFATKNYLAVAVVVLLGIAIAQFAKSKPAVNEYELSNHGLKISGKFYPISSFKSFSVYKEGAIDALNLISSRRLVPDLTIYFAPDDRNRILDVLQQFLPQSAYRPGAIDKIATRTKF